MTQLVPFTPSDAMRLSKARFEKAMEGQWRDAKSMTVEEICKLAKSPKLKQWLPDPQFQAWFFETDSASVKIQAARELAVEELVEVLRADIDPKAGVTAPAKVRAAELIMQYGGMQPPKKIENTNKTNIVSDMAPEELKHFLKTNMKKLIMSLPQAERDELLGIVPAQPGDSK